jgi:hypothetical protein
MKNTFVLKVAILFGIIGIVGNFFVFAYPAIKYCELTYPSHNCVWDDVSLLASITFYWILAGIFIGLIFKLSNKKYLSYTLLIIFTFVLLIFNFMLIAAGQEGIQGSYEPAAKDIPLAPTN